MADVPEPRTVRLSLSLRRGDDLGLLRGALRNARATELAELLRRDDRLAFGYGSDSARDGMSDEITQRRRRIELLDALIEGLTAADGASEA